MPDQPGNAVPVPTGMVEVPAGPEPLQVSLGGPGHAGKFGLGLPAPGTLLIEFRQVDACPPDLGRIHAPAFIDPADKEGLPVLCLPSRDPGWFCLPFPRFPV